MSDSAIRDLERLGKDAPAGSVERYRWRLALVREGRGDEAGLETGDRVEVEICDACRPGPRHLEPGTRLRASLVNQDRSMKPTTRFEFNWLIESERDGRFWTLLHEPITLLEPARPA